MAPPHLHPRSRMTSTLFATTVAASFFVVALPHVLPCPAPRVAFADSEMADGGGGTTTRRRRRKRPETVPAPDHPETTTTAMTTSDGSGMIQFQPSSKVDGGKANGVEILLPAGASKRECPVPKPKGVLGELLGFNNNNNNAGNNKEDNGSNNSAGGNAGDSQSKHER